MKDGRIEILERHRDSVAVIERLRYVLPTGATSDDGDLQLRFADGAVVRFRVGGDGERLEVLEEAWTDPFAAPLSAENAAFVATSGAWRLFDVSREAGARDWIGKRIARVEVTRSSAVLDSSDGLRLRVVADADEHEVYFR